MKRNGYIYDRMADWNLLREAQIISCKCKGHNIGVRMHKANWISNLAEIQSNILSHQMTTSEYKHEYKVSGHGKLRDIAKLKFHPSHIQHQAIVMASHDEIDRTFFAHTYASRKGYGQHKGAIQLNKWVQKHSKIDGEYPVYLQLDICKYYENIPHSLLRIELERTFKDKDYVDAYLEPINRFAPDGIGIPLGIRPSQILGNLALRPLDKYIKEELKCRYYIRYLDDMVLLCRNKGEAHRFADSIIRFLSKCGFKLHQPRIDKIQNGIDFLGYVCYPYKGMFWRKSNKVAWLKRRSRIKNKKRLREIDASAWGYISHGNRHCKKLYKMQGGISFEKLGIKKPSPTDKNGKRIIEAPILSMAMVLDKPITILDVEAGIVTTHGADRVAMMVNLMGMDGKLIINAPMKEFFVDLWRRGITKAESMFIDKGGKHYDFNPSATRIIEINHRAVGEVNDKFVYLDTNEQIKL